MIQLIKRTNAKERLLVLASVLFIVGQVWMDLKVPDYMSQITTLLQTPNTAISEILKPGGWMILLSLMSFVFFFYCRFIRRELNLPPTSRDVWTSNGLFHV